MLFSNTMDKIFETWIFNGVRYLAVNLPGRIHVVDEDGRNFGTFASMPAHFRQLQRRGGSESTRPVEGKVALTVRAVAAQ